MAAADIIVRYSGSYLQAVDAVMQFGRMIWDLAFSRSDVPVKKSGRSGEWTLLREEDLRQLSLELPAELITTCLDQLAADKKYRVFDNDLVGFDVDMFHPVMLARALLGGLRPDHELRYFVMRNMREHYRCNLSSNIARLLYALARTANGIRSARTSNDISGAHPHWKYIEEFRDPLVAFLDQQQVPNAEEALKLFIECCRSVGYIKPSYKSGHINFRATIDPEYLIGNLFGMPTDIRGFDDLFGGGGLILAENLMPASTANDSPGSLDGRTVLIVGRFGTGKTLLSLKLAAEVARKGGLAWVMPLEHSIQECLYVLESMSALPADNSVVVAKNIEQAVDVLQEPRPGRGALIILKTIKNSYDNFLATFKENARRMQQYPLRVIIADPINSVLRDVPSDSTLLRTQMMNMIEVVNGAGTNVLLVAEEGSDLRSERGNGPFENIAFEQNIADTVIRLSVERRHDYDQRYFEIMKSRFQREQRGQHPFAIRPGEGIHIFPSSAAVMSTVRARTSRPPLTTITLGLPSLDEILGPNAVMAGDVIAMQGPEGSLKTLLGLLFLLESDSKPGRKSLLVAARDDEASIRHMLGQKLFSANEQASKTVRDIRICTLPRGFVEPGYVLQIIEDEFAAARREGVPIDRIMVDDIAHWELSSPQIRADETFGDTLVELLRRLNVSSLLVCGEITQDSPAVLQRSIVNDADCVIKFDRFVHRGANRVMLQVLKTRSMTHLRESFELTLGANGLEVKPGSSLLRFSPNGRIRPINVRLFLHSETDMQEKYNHSLVQTIKAVLSRETEVEAEDPIEVSHAMKLGSSSAVDELQILQLDEFQMPGPDHNGPSLSLYTFPSTVWDSAAWGPIGRTWGDFVPRLTQRNHTYENGFFAIPLYVNVSLLAYRSDKLSSALVQSWEALADACAEWERQTDDSDELFFDFPRSTPENYNCLFLEILFSLDKPDFDRPYELLDWILRPDGIKASLILRQLCRRAYLRGVGNDLVKLRNPEITPNIDVNVNPRALVWRHWYTTLNHMMSQMPLREQHRLAVVPLPGDVSIAGEWYVGIPLYSAAPAVGLEVIKLMTSPEAEVERLFAGVGLPTRQTYYGDGQSREEVEAAISPYFSMPIGEIRRLVNQSFRRSNIHGYAKYSRPLARCLQRIIALPDQDSLESQIRQIFRDLENPQFLHISGPDMQ